MLAIAACFLTLSVPHLNVSSTTFASEYATLRSYSLVPPGTEPAELKSAIDAFRALDNGLPNRITLASKGEREAGPNGDRAVRDLYWSVIDSVVFPCSDVDALEERAAKLPETIGGYLDTRGTMKKIVDAMRSAEKAYNEKTGLADDKSVSDTKKWWMDKGEPATDRIYHWIDGLLGFDQPPKEIKVLVVPRYPGKGAITLRGLGGPLIIVGCEKFKEDNFAEALIHESIHAVETAAKNVELLADLRARLKERRVDGYTEEQFPHTLFFMIAGEATRRFIDPKHVDIGAAFGTYRRGLEPYRVYAAPIMDALYSGNASRLAVSKKLSEYGRP